MKRVLCAVDLSDVSVGLLPYAHAIVHWYGGCLTVLHVVPTFDAVERHPGEWFDPVTVVYSMRRDDVIEHMRHASASSWRMARERTQPRTVASSETRTDIIGQKPICGRPEHQRESEIIV